MMLAFHFNAISLHSIAYASASRMVDCLVEGTLVAAFAGLVLRMSRRWNSGTRFAVWFCALAVVAALPLFGVMFGGMLGAIGNTSWAVGAGPFPAAVTRAEITLPGLWAFWLFGVWATIAAFGLTRVAVGLWRLRGLRRSCVELDWASLDPELRETLTRFAQSNGTRSALLCVSDLVTVPTVIGFVNPAVVLPQWLMNELSPSELKQVLLHELAHLQRWDDWMNLAQKILKALLFFHPAVWWMERQLSLEREMACDDVVIAETANPRAYAECLTHLAERSFVRRSIALAQAALGRVRQTSLRVAQILDARHTRTRRPSWRPAMVLATAFAIVCATAISKAPQLVGFEDSVSRQPQVARASSVTSVSSSALFRSPSDKQVTTGQLRTRLHPMKDPVTAMLRNSQPAVPAQSAAQEIELGAQRGLFQSPVVVAESWSVVIAGTTAPISPAMISDLAYSPEFYSRESATSLRPITQALFVIVEGPGPSSGAETAYRIRVWRVIVQQPANTSSPATIPHKET